MVVSLFRRAASLTAVWIAVAAGLAVKPSWGLAQQPAPQIGNQSDSERMFRSLDANKDGKLTMDEAGPNSRQMLQHIFEMAEKPVSGSVSRDEFQKVFDRHRAGGSPPPRSSSPQQSLPDRGESSFPPILRLLDSNGDERLTKAELNRLSQLFDRLDANKDGSLDAEELRAAEQTAVEGGARNSGSSNNERPTNSTNPDRRTTTGESNSQNQPRPLQGRTAPNNSRPTTGSGGTSRLGGIWRGWVVRGRGENPNEREMEVELTIEGDRITGRELGTQRAPGGLGAGTFVMTGNGNSGNLDADGTAGPQDGRHFLGIYELQGDTLRWCVSNRGRQRPTVMASDRGNYLMILQRQGSRS